MTVDSMILLVSFGSSTMSKTWEMETIRAGETGFRKGDPRQVLESQSRMPPPHSHSGWEEAVLEGAVLKAGTRCSVSQAKRLAWCLLRAMASSAIPHDIPRERGHSPMHGM